MPHCLKHNLFYIHIPKTAGTSIEKALDMQKDECFYSENRVNKTFKISPQHLCYLTLDSFFNFKNFTLFTVVRNPFDRIVSEYKYIQHEENQYWNKFKKLKFDSFIQEVFSLDESERSGLFDDHFKPQYKFIEGGEDKIQVFKYENIQEVFDWLNLKTNLVLNFPHERKSNKMHCSMYYKYKDTIDFVRNFYEKDFEIFNYSLELEYR
jgi:hypothetical protein